ncbi:MAG TPA: winged helix-turn-helix domain-containing protein [Methanospirillum sp.]|uniref:winged helix-turn-helix domain-containing protein n=1 Tax=Methanospirillum sp. TaxID=45200 RepID=UPI002C8881B8|nr:winged helix-turn-helix domain-containing protein [Methanospirillum sp.]HWQ63682.1 winged helix-turn-helix domain-containing protein [Methanospirillum sp.]
MHQRLVLQYLPKPDRKDLIDDAYWICDTLGLSSGRDVEDLSIRIVLSLLKESSKKEGIASEQLADLLGITTGRVNHHIRNLSRSGVIYRNRRLIHLRGRSMRESVQELRKDAERIFDDLEKVASEIDSMMGLPGSVSGLNESHALVLPSSPKR